LKTPLAWLTLWWRSVAVLLKRDGSSSKKYKALRKHDCEQARAWTSIVHNSHIRKQHTTASALRARCPRPPRASPNRLPALLRPEARAVDRVGCSPSEERGHEQKRADHDRSAMAVLPA
jgi:hypothetical protein